MISDEMLRIAAGEYEQALLSALPKTAECDHSFSVKFEKKMRHLCHKVKHASAYSVLKRVACAAIAIILCGSALLMLNKDVRAAVIGWIKDTHKSYIRYSFTGEVETVEPVGYELTKIPEGYTLLAKQETDAGNIAIYQNGEGQIMQFGYYAKESGTLFVGGYEYTHSQVAVSGRDADLYMAKDTAHSNTITWKSADGSVLFQLTAFLEKDALIQVAEGVSPIVDQAGNASAVRAYEFEEIPEGYVFMDRADTDSGTSILYMREDGRILSLDYDFGVDKNTFFFKPEDHTYLQENVDGMTMDIYLSKSPEYNSAILWSTDGKTIFTISASCDKNTLIELAKSVRPVK